MIFKCSIYIYTRTHTLIYILNNEIRREWDRDKRENERVRDVKGERERERVCVRDWVVENGGTEIWKDKYNRAIVRTFCPHYT